MARGSSRAGFHVSSRASGRRGSWWVGSCILNMLDACKLPRTFNWRGAYEQQVIWLERPVRVQPAAEDTIASTAAAATARHEVMLMRESSSHPEAQTTRLLHDNPRHLTHSTVGRFICS